MTEHALKIHVFSDFDKTERLIYLHIVFVLSIGCVRGLFITQLFDLVSGRADPRGGPGSGGPVDYTDTSHHTGPAPGL